MSKDLLNIHIPKVKISKYFYHRTKILKKKEKKRSKKHYQFYHYITFYNSYTRVQNMN